MIKKVLAQGITPIRNPVVSIFNTTDPSKPGDLLGKIISSLIGLILVIASIWAFFQVLQAGLQWISSGGDKGKLEEAQKKLTNALIGLLILFISWGLFVLILNFLGIIKGGALNFTLPKF